MLTRVKDYLARMPADRAMREMVRRGDNDGLRALALQVATFDEPLMVRRHVPPDEDSPARWVGSLPLVHVIQPSSLDMPLEIHRDVRIMSTGVPCLWTSDRQRLFAVGCAWYALHHLGFPSRERPLIETLAAEVMSQLHLPFAERSSRRLLEIASKGIVQGAARADPTWRLMMTLRGALGAVNPPQHGTQLAQQAALLLASLVAQAHHGTPLRRDVMQPYMESVVAPLVLKAKLAPLDVLMSSTPEFWRGD